MQYLSHTETVSIMTHVHIGIKNSFHQMSSVWFITVVGYVQS